MQIRRRNALPHHQAIFKMIWTVGGETPDGARAFLRQLAELDWEELHRGFSDITLELCCVCDRAFPCDEMLRFQTEDGPWLCCDGCEERMKERFERPCDFCGEPFIVTSEQRYQDLPLCLECRRDRELRQTWQMIHSHILRARSNGQPATLTLRQWLAALEHFGGRCAYCRQYRANTLDHFIPVVKGGGTTADNSVPACGNCNSRKGAILPDAPDFPEKLRAHLDEIREYLASVT